MTLKIGISVWSIKHLEINVVSIHDIPLQTRIACMTQLANSLPELYQCNWLRNTTLAMYNSLHYIYVYSIKHNGLVVNIRYLTNVCVCLTCVTYGSIIHFIKVIDG